jgi:hypothetical protein
MPDRSLPSRSDRGLLQAHVADMTLEDLKHVAAEVALELDRRQRPDRVEIERLWNEGIPSHVIARRMGLTAGSLQDTVHKMRHRYGYDMPYRHQPRKRQT